MMDIHFTNSLAILLVSLLFDRLPVACKCFQKYNFFTNHTSMATVASTFNVLQSVDSTNNYAMAKVHAGMAKHGDSFFTMQQTNGKGQRGKHWVGSKDQNIAISIVIEPSLLSLSQQFQLSAAVALGTFYFFSNHAGNETSIKWPNDIYWRDRKAAGILIENVIGSQGLQLPGQNNMIWKYAVAGIGVNINQTQFDGALANPISLKQITGKHFDCTELAKQLQQMVLTAVDEVLNGSFEKILQQYNEHLFKKGCSVQLKKDSVLFEATIQSVNEAGQLLTTDVPNNHFNFGTIEWVLK